jgi:hypothetical protein
MATVDLVCSCNLHNTSTNANTVQKHYCKHQSTVPLFVYLVECTYAKRYTLYTVRLQVHVFGNRCKKHVYRGPTKPNLYADSICRLSLPSTTYGTNGIRHTAYVAYMADLHIVALYIWLRIRHTVHTVHTAFDIRLTACGMRHSPSCYTLLINDQQPGICEVHSTANPSCATLCLTD